jgi:ubiquinone/menaquinone biosynthesis C-methylase UbiE
VSGSGKSAGGADRPFAGDTASFYARYRRAYPSDLISHLQEVSRGGRLLDLIRVSSCSSSPGSSQAVGTDPEPDMLREARRAARQRRVENAEWVLGGSADLPSLESALGRFDLVTIGTAFHFMEPRAVLGDLWRIAPGGAVAPTTAHRCWRAASESQATWWRRCGSAPSSVAQIAEPDETDHDVSRRFARDSVPRALR